MKKIMYLIFPQMLFPPERPDPTPKINGKTSTDYSSVKFGLQLGAVISRLNMCLKQEQRSHQKKNIFSS